MNLSSKIAILAAVIVAIVVIFFAYTFLLGAFAQLENKQVERTIIATQNVEIQATTFNGDISFGTSTSNQIEVTYDLQAPQGHMNEITTSTTNQTKNDNTEIIAEAKTEGNGPKVN